jgi:hypothetical protein
MPQDQQQNNGFYSYQSNNDPVQAFKGLIQSVAQEPQQIETQNLADEAKNQQLAQMYQSTPVPDFAFNHMGEMQALVDKHNALGTKLYQAGFDPYANGAALNDPDSANDYKDFVQTGNQILQSNSVRKGIQNWWEDNTKEIQSNPSQYAPDALDQVNNYANGVSLDDFLKGKAGLPPTPQKLQKPYDFNAFLSKARLGTLYNDNGIYKEKAPGAILAEFNGDYLNNQQTAPYWNKLFTTLSPDQQHLYAARAIANHMDPNGTGFGGAAYQYGLDVANQSLLGKTIDKTRGNGKVTLADRNANGQSKLINGIVGGDTNSENMLLNSIKGTASMNGKPQFVTNPQTGNREIHMPEQEKYDRYSNTSTKVPAQVIVIDKNDPNTGVRLGSFLNQYTDFKANPNLMVPQLNKPTITKKSSGINWQ